MKKINNSVIQITTLGNEQVKQIIRENDKKEYLKKEMKGILVGEIIDLYLDCDPEVYNDITFGRKNVVEDLMVIYPNLTFGEIKQAIEGYFVLTETKQPINIKFPRIMVESFLKSHSKKETCQEFGYTQKELDKNLKRAKKPFEMSEEEYRIYKMEILKNDVQMVDNRMMTLGQFRRKHTYNGVTLTPKMVRPLIEEYTTTLNQDATTKSKVM